MARKAFLTDVKTLRKRAREHIEPGAVSPGYKAKRETVCVLRYRRHHFMAHATEEQAHADLVAGRIVQLGGEPDLSPEGLLTRSHAEYVEGATLVDVIKEDLVAERSAIDSYREMIAYLANDDPTTRRMLEEILAMEEEHADDLVTLLEDLG